MIRWLRIRVAQLLHKLSSRTYPGDWVDAWGAATWKLYMEPGGPGGGTLGPSGRRGNSWAWSGVWVKWTPLGTVVSSVCFRGDSREEVEQMAMCGATCGVKK